MATRQKSTLYVDESGVPALTDKKSKYFILTGVKIDSFHDTEISGYFSFLKREHAINEGRAFHTVDLFEDATSSDYLSDTAAKKLSRSLSEFIKLAPFEFYSLYLEKDDIRNRIGVPIGTTAHTFRSTTKGKTTRDIAYDILASRLFFRYVKLCLGSKNSRGAVIAESRKSADHALLDAFLFCKEPSAYTRRKTRKKMRNYGVAEDMRDKITSIKFENKIGECCGLEIADIISYVISLNINGKLPKLKKRGLDLIWKAIEAKAKKQNAALEAVQKSQLFSSLPPGRVHDMSDFSKQFK